MNAKYLNIFEKVQMILKNDFNVIISDVETTLKSELTSIDIITFYLLIEDEFEISYNFEKPLKTIMDVVEFVFESLGEYRDV